MRQENFTDETLLEFWRSGEDQADAVFRNIEHHLCLNFRPEHALDFGCGVGRLLFAWSKKCHHVTGVDVSPSRIAEAKRQADTCFSEFTDHGVSGVTCYFQKARR
jgi:cyclopropane fatty-acyl-phospholipid synthase-like methyltransferase